MPSETRIVALYCLFGIVWIVGSDSVLHLLFGPFPQLYATLQSIKGILYVIVTAVLLYILMRMEFRKRQRMSLELLDNERLRLELDKEIKLRELRGRFISTFSHDFRTPLASVSSAVGMIDRYSDRMDAAQRRGYIERIYELIREVTDMLDDMLTMMKAEAIEPKFQPDAINLVDLCAQMIEETQLYASDKHRITFNTNGDETLHIRGDRSLLRRAIGNLLSNAVKYSPNGGEVTLSLKNVGLCVMLSITDKGIGIPETDQAILFEPFKRGSNTGAIIGTGLGLTIMQQVVTLHGGKVELESAVDKGTTFRLLFPLYTLN